MIFYALKLEGRTAQQFKLTHETSYAKAKNLKSSMIQDTLIYPITMTIFQVCCDHRKIRLLIILFWVNQFLATAILTKWISTLY